MRMNVEERLMDLLFLLQPSDENVDNEDEELSGRTRYLDGAASSWWISNFQFCLLGISFSLCVMWYGVKAFIFTYRHRKRKRWIYETLGIWKLIPPKAVPKLASKAKSTTKKLSEAEPTSSRPLYFGHRQNKVPGNQSDDRDHQKNSSLGYGSQIGASSRDVLPKRISRPPSSDHVKPSQTQHVTGREVNTKYGPTATGIPRKDVNEATAVGNAKNPVKANELPVVIDQFVQVKYLHSNGFRKRGDMVQHVQQDTTSSGLNALDETGGFSRTTTESQEKIIQKEGIEKDRNLHSPMGETKSGSPMNILPEDDATSDLLNAEVESICRKYETPTDKISDLPKEPLDGRRNHTVYTHLMKPGKYQPVRMAQVSKGVSSCISCGTRGSQISKPAFLRREFTGSRQKVRGIPSFSTGTLSTITPKRNASLKIHRGKRNAQNFKNSESSVSPVSFGTRQRVLLLRKNNPSHKQRAAAVGIKPNHRYHNTDFDTGDVNKESNTISTEAISVQKIPDRPEHWTKSNILTSNTFFDLRKQIAQKEPNCTHKQRVRAVSDKTDQRYVESLFKFDPRDAKKESNTARKESEDSEHSKDDTTASEYPVEISNQITQQTKLQIGGVTKLKQANIRQNVPTSNKQFLRKSTRCAPNPSKPFSELSTATGIINKIRQLLWDAYGGSNKPDEINKEKRKKAITRKRKKRKQYLLTAVPASYILKSKGTLTGTPLPTPQIDTKHAEFNKPSTPSPVFRKMRPGDNLVNRILQKGDCFTSPQKSSPAASQIKRDPNPRIIESKERILESRSRTRAKSPVKLAIQASTEEDRTMSSETHLLSDSLDWESTETKPARQQILSQDTGKIYQQRREPSSPPASRKLQKKFVSPSVDQDIEISSQRQRQTITPARAFHQTWLSSSHIKGSSCDIPKPGPVRQSVTRHNLQKGTKLLQKRQCMPRYGEPQIEDGVKPDVRLERIQRFKQLAKDKLAQCFQSKKRALGSPGAGLMSCSSSVDMLAQVTPQSSSSFKDGPENRQPDLVASKSSFNVSEQAKECVHMIESLSTPVTRDDFCDTQLRRTLNIATSTKCQAKCHRPDGFRQLKHQQTSNMPSASTPPGRSKGQLASHYYSGRKGQERSTQTTHQNRGPSENQDEISRRKNAHLACRGGKKKQITSAARPPHPEKDWQGNVSVGLNSRTNPMPAQNSSREVKILACTDRKKTGLTKSKIPRYITRKLHRHQTSARRSSQSFPSPDQTSSIRQTKPRKKISTSSPTIHSRKYTPSQASHSCVKTRNADSNGKQSPRQFLCQALPPMEGGQISHIADLKKKQSRLRQFVDKLSPPKRSHKTSPCCGLKVKGSYFFVDKPSSPIGSHKFVGLRGASSQVSNPTPSDISVQTLNKLVSLLSNRNKRYVSPDREVRMYSTFAPIDSRPLVNVDRPTCPSPSYTHQLSSPDRPEFQGITETTPRLGSKVNLWLATKCNVDANKPAARLEAEKQRKLSFRTQPNLAVQKNWCKQDLLKSIDSMYERSEIPSSSERLRHICSPIACRLCGTHIYDATTCDMGRQMKTTSHLEYTMNIESRANLSSRDNMDLHFEQAAYPAKPTPEKQRRLSFEHMTEKNARKNAKRWRIYDKKANQLQHKYKIRNKVSEDSVNLKKSNFLMSNEIPRSIFRGPREKWQLEDVASATEEDNFVCCYLAQDGHSVTDGTAPSEMSRNEHVTVFPTMQTSLSPNTLTATGATDTMVSPGLSRRKPRSPIMTRFPAGKDRAALPGAPRNEHRPGFASLRQSRRSNTMVFPVVTDRAAPSPELMRTNRLAGLPNFQKSRCLNTITVPVVINSTASPELSRNECLTTMTVPLVATLSRSECCLTPFCPSPDTLTSYSPLFEIPINESRVSTTPIPVSARMVNPAPLSVKAAVVNTSPLSVTATMVKTARKHPGNVRAAKGLPNNQSLRTNRDTFSLLQRGSSPKWMSPLPNLTKRYETYSTNRKRPKGVLEMSEKRDKIPLPRLSPDETESGVHGMRTFSPYSSTCRGTAHIEGEYCVIPTYGLQTNVEKREHKPITDLHTFRLLGQQDRGLGVLAQKTKPVRNRQSSKSFHETESTYNWDYPGNIFPSDSCASLDTLLSMRRGRGESTLKDNGALSLPLHSLRSIDVDKKSFSKSIKAWDDDDRTTGYRPEGSPPIQHYKRHSDLQTADTFKKEERPEVMFKVSEDCYTSFIMPSPHLQEDRNEIKGLPSAIEVLSLSHEHKTTARETIRFADAAPARLSTGGIDIKVRQTKTSLRRRQVGSRNHPSAVVLSGIETRRPVEDQRAVVKVRGAALVKGEGGDNILAARGKPRFSLATRQTHNMARKWDHNPEVERKHPKNPPNPSNDTFLALMRSKQVVPQMNYKSSTLNKEKAVTKVKSTTKTISPKVSPMVTFTEVEVPGSSNYRRTKLIKTVSNDIPWERSKEMVNRDLPDTKIDGSYLGNTNRTISNQLDQVCGTLSQAPPDYLHGRNGTVRNANLIDWPEKFGPNYTLKPNRLYKEQLKPDVFQSEMEADAPILKPTAPTPFAYPEQVCLQSRKTANLSVHSDTEVITDKKHSGAEKEEARALGQPLRQSSNSATGICRSEDSVAEMRYDNMLQHCPQDKDGSGEAEHGLRASTNVQGATVVKNTQKRENALVLNFDRQNTSPPFLNIASKSPAHFTQELQKQMVSSFKTTTRSVLTHMSKQKFEFKFGKTFSSGENRLRRQESPFIRKGKSPSNHMPLNRRSLQQNSLKAAKSPFLGIADARHQRLASHFPATADVKSQGLASHFPATADVKSQGLASQFPGTAEVKHQQLASHFPGTAEAKPKRLASHFPGTVEVKHQRLASHFPGTAEAKPKRLASHFPGTAEVKHQRLASHFPGTAEAKPQRLASHFPGTAEVKPQGQISQSLGTSDVQQHRSTNRGNIRFTFTHQENQSTTACAAADVVDHIRYDSGKRNVVHAPASSEKDLIKIPVGGIHSQLPTNSGSFLQLRQQLGYPAFTDRYLSRPFGSSNQATAFRAEYNEKDLPAMWALNERHDRCESPKPREQVRGHNPKVKLSGKTDFSIPSSADVTLSWKMNSSDHDVTTHSGFLVKDRNITFYEGVTSPDAVYGLQGSSAMLPFDESERGTEDFTIVQAAPSPPRSILRKSPPLTADVGGPVTSTVRKKRAFMIDEGWPVVNPVRKRKAHIIDESVATANTANHARIEEDETAAGTLRWGKSDDKTKLQKFRFVGAEERNERKSKTRAGIPNLEFVKQNGGVSEAVSRAKNCRQTQNPEMRVRMFARSEKRIPAREDLVRWDGASLGRAILQTHKEGREHHFTNVTLDDQVDYYGQSSRITEGGHSKFSEEPERCSNTRAKIKQQYSKLELESTNNSHYTYDIRETPLWGNMTKNNNKTGGLPQVVGKLPKMLSVDKMHPCLMKHTALSDANSDEQFCQKDGTVPKMLGENHNALKPPHSRNVDFSVKTHSDNTDSGKNCEVGDTEYSSSEVSSKTQINFDWYKPSTSTAAESSKINHQGSRGRTQGKEFRSHMGRNPEVVEFDAGSNESAAVGGSMGSKDWLSKGSIRSSSSAHNRWLGQENDRSVLRSSSWCSPQVLSTVSENGQFLSSGARVGTPTPPVCYPTTRTCEPKPNYNADTNRPPVFGAEHRAQRICDRLHSGIAEAGDIDESPQEDNDWPSTDSLACRNPPTTSYRTTTSPSSSLACRNPLTTSGYYRTTTSPSASLACRNPPTTSGYYRTTTSSGSLACRNSPTGGCYRASTVSSCSSSQSNNTVISNAYAKLRDGPVPSTSEPTADAPIPSPTQFPSPVHYRSVSGFSYLYNDSDKTDHTNREDYERYSLVPLNRRAKILNEKTRVGQMVKMFENKMRLRPPCPGATNATV